MSGWLHLCGHCGLVLLERLNAAGGTTFYHAAESRRVTCDVAEPAFITRAREELPALEGSIYSELVYLGPSRAANIAAACGGLLSRPATAVVDALAELARRGLARVVVLDGLPTWVASTPPRD